MTMSWNGKAVIDAAAEESWDTSTAFRSKLVRYANEIMNDIAYVLPQDYFLFKLKKLIPTEQEIVSLSPQIPSQPSASVTSGGFLTESATYMVYVTFVLFDADARTYIESEPSVASSDVTTSGSNLQVNVTNIDVYDGSNIIPNTIYRRVYLSRKLSTESSFSEPFLHTTIYDNTTTSIGIATESSSTVTPPSASEVDQLSSTQMCFNSGNRYLNRVDISQLRRFDPDSSSSSEPDAFDFYGPDGIFIYPKLTATATIAQRTLSYFVYRRPHEIFYDSDVKIDLPIQAKRALIQGIVWKAHQFLDRDGYVSKRNEYEESKKQFIEAMTRQRGAPSSVRDVNGDTDGFLI